METNDRNDGLARWHAQRRDGFGPYAGGSAQSGGEELQRGTLAGSRAMVMPSKKHGINVMLERALELSPRWADAARGFQRGRVERRRAGRRAGRGATLRRARRRREARHAASARGGRCDARPRGRQLGNGRSDAGRCACGGRDLMELSPWRIGGRRAWTTVEVQTLTECAAREMGTLAIWRSGCLPGRSEGAIRAALTKHGLWQCRQQAHFDGERCELSVWVFPAMKARLRQRAQRDGIALSELVRRFCDQGLRA